MSTFSSTYFPQYSRLFEWVSSPQPDPPSFTFPPPTSSGALHPDSIVSQDPLPPSLSLSLSNPKDFAVFNSESSQLFVSVGTLIPSKGPPGASAMGKGPSHLRRGYSDGEREREKEKDRERERMREREREKEKESDRNESDGHPSQSASKPFDSPIESAFQQNFNMNGNTSNSTTHSTQNVISATNPSPSPPPPSIAIPPPPPGFGAAAPPPQPFWFYIDPFLRVQGPFSSADMTMWFGKGFFEAKLEIAQMNPLTMKPQLPFTQLGEWFAQGKSAFLPKIPPPVVTMNFGAAQATSITMQTSNAANQSQLPHSGPLHPHPQVGMGISVGMYSNNSVPPQPPPSIPSPSPVAPPQSFNQWNHPPSSQIIPLPQATHSHPQSFNGVPHGPAGISSLQHSSHPVVSNVNVSPSVIGPPPRPIGTVGTIGAPTQPVGVQGLQGTPLVSNTQPKLNPVGYPPNQQLPVHPVWGASPSLGLAFSAPPLVAQAVSQPSPPPQQSIIQPHIQSLPLLESVQPSIPSTVPAPSHVPTSSPQPNVAAAVPPSGIPTRSSRVWGQVSAGAQKSLAEIQQEEERLAAERAARGEDEDENNDEEEEEDEVIDNIAPAFTQPQPSPPPPTPAVPIAVARQSATEKEKPKEKEKENEREKEKPSNLDSQKPPTKGNQKEKEKEKEKDSKPADRPRYQIREIDPEPLVDPPKPIEKEKEKKVADKAKKEHKENHKEVDKEKEKEKDNPIDRSERTPNSSPSPTQREDNGNTSTTLPKGRTPKTKASAPGAVVTPTPSPPSTSAPVVNKWVAAAPTPAAAVDLKTIQAMEEERSSREAEVERQKEIDREKELQRIGAETKVSSVWGGVRPTPSSGVMSIKDIQALEAKQSELKASQQAAMAHQSGPKGQGPPETLAQILARKTGNVASTSTVPSKVVNVVANVVAAPATSNANSKAPTKASSPTTSTSHSSNSQSSPSSSSDGVVADFWSESVEAAASPSKQSTSTSSPTKSSSPSPSPSSGSAFGSRVLSGEFAIWCSNEFLSLTGSSDLTLATYLINLESDDQIEETIQHYLGEKQKPKVVKAFTQEFIKMKDFNFGEESQTKGTNSVASSAASPSGKGGKKKK